MAETIIFQGDDLEFGLSEVFGCFVHSKVPPPFSLVAGEKYRVEWGNQTFDVTAIDTDAVIPGSVSVGNGAAYMLPGNNEPFIIAASPTDVSFISLADQEATTRSITVNHVTEDDPDDGEGDGEDPGDEPMPPEEEPDEPDISAEGIILKDRKGEDVAYYGIETLTVDTTTEGKQQTFTKGIAVEGLEIVPDFAGGDMAIVAGEDMLVRSAIIRKPEDLVPEKIAENEFIAGVGPGTFKGGPKGPYIEYTLNEAGEPVTAKMFGFTTIPTGCFRSMSSLETVDISECPNITAIGDYAFAGCSALKYFDIPSSVTSIGEGAFDGCNSIENIFVPDGITMLSKFVFRNCTVAQITIPDSVTEIGSNAFYGCNAIDSINIPSCVTTIGGSAFWACTSLKSVVIPDSVATIGTYAFYNCTALEEVTIGAGITEIPTQTFKGCTSLRTVNFARENITTIGVAAFMGCTSLTRVTVPLTVTSIGNQAFQDCSALNYLWLSSVVTIGNSAVRGCSSLTEVTIPTTCMSIGQYAFQGCTALKTATFMTPGGWYRYTSSTSTSGTGITLLANTATAATYLRSTYAGYYWKRT